MSPPFPKTYLHHFTCGHSESYHGILVPSVKILNLPHPCACCEPYTVAGQERLQTMMSWDNLTVPYVTDEGDVIMAPRGSKNYPALLSIRDIGERFEVGVVSVDSAEGMGICTVYGIEVGRRD